MKTHFDKGDAVVYQYKHWLNSRSSTTITKDAVFVRTVKQRAYGRSPNPKVVIQVNGNKNTSTVWRSQISHIKID